MSTRAGADQVGRSCPYCRFSLKGGVQVVGCPSCRAVHHSECWEENGGCAVMGCTSAPAPAGAQAPVAAPPAPAAPLPPRAPRPDQPPPLAAPPPGATAHPPPPLPPQAAAGPPATVAPGQPLPPPTGQPLPPPTGQPLPPPTGQPLPPPAGKPGPTPAELVDRIKTWLNTPVIAAAGLTGVTAAAILLVVGLALAILTPESSSLNNAGGSGLFTETLRLTLATLMVRFGFEGTHFIYLPLLFVLVPLAASALAARRHCGRTAHLPVGSRLLAGAGGALVLAAIMLFLGALSREDGFGAAPGSVILFCLLWGGLGGLAGAARGSGPGSLSVLTTRIPAAPARYLGLAGLALRPLVLLLAITGLVGVVAWTVQIARGQDSAKAGRPAALALVETPVYAAEFAVGIVALGALAEVQPLGEGIAIRASPLPFEDGEDFSSFFEPWRIFAFAEHYAIFVFVFALILVVGLPLALAGYGGYAIARAAGARTAWLGAAHGAIVGVVWAVALTLLRAIGDMRWLVGDSVFASVLLTASAAGAAGGALASRRAGGTAEPEPEPAPAPAPT